MISVRELEDQAFREFTKKEKQKAEERNLIHKINDRNKQ